MLQYEKRKGPRGGKNRREKKCSPEGAWKGYQVAACEEGRKYVEKLKYVNEGKKKRKLLSCSSGKGKEKGLWYRRKSPLRRIEKNRRKLEARKVKKKQTQTRMKWRKKSSNRNDGIWKNCVQKLRSEIIKRQKHGRKGGRKINSCRRQREREGRKNK